MSSLFSADWNWRFYRLDECVCGRNVWRKDWDFHKSSRGRDRYSCFYCGRDVYPGGAVSAALAGVGASSIAPDELSLTDGGIEGITP